ncbi:MBL fold metallo-hydrolase [Pseudomonas aeruginosa]|nr:MBL fold metallo-hydrolase [Pseudomonas aeruginosa]
METGIGAFFPPALRQRYGVQEERHVLLDSLAAVGLDDADIDVVLLTHLHFDYAGGLLAAWEEGQPRLLFPNAHFVSGRRHWQRARQPHPPTEPRSCRNCSTCCGRADAWSCSMTASARRTWAGLAFPFQRRPYPGPDAPGDRHADGPVVFSGDLIPGAPGYTYR